MLVSKFADHLPLYGQAQIYARRGVHLDRSTLTAGVGRAAFLLRPVHKQMLGYLKASSKLFADETTALVLDPGRHRTKTGQLFAHARDDRPRQVGDPPAVVFVYTPDRKAECPVDHLHGLAGTLQVDGYAGYRALAKKGKVTARLLLLGARATQILRARHRGPAPIAAEALERVAAVYRIETKIAVDPPTRSVSFDRSEATRFSAPSRSSCAKSSR